MNQLEESSALRALPIEEALRYATSLAELLRQMHRDGTVCGSLDPRSIAWDNRTVKLVAIDSGSSPAYRAPEQVRGEAADARSDIFAFGAILYELLAGRRAFPAQDPEELRKQILESSPLPVDGIPEGISSLLRGCLEKERGLRWQRMNSILSELKLANAAARQAHSAASAAAQQTAQESAVAELRQTIQRLEESLAAMQDTIAGLQKAAQIQSKTIESMQVAASQTDEVVEQVVEAFGTIHKSW
jgi:serine/threonine protein kinase